MFDANWRWQCVSDPTAQPEFAYRGDFYGGCFRWCDLEASRVEQTWPDGITFHNIRTGEKLVYLNGQLVTQ